MKGPRCIRIFYSQKASTNAKKILEEGGFKVFVKEDKFAGFPLSKFHMFRRFRLYVQEEDINKVGEYLAKKLKKE